MLDFILIQVEVIWAHPQVDQSHDLCLLIHNSSRNFNLNLNPTTLVTILLLSIFTHTYINYDSFFIYDSLA